MSREIPGWSFHFFKDKKNEGSEEIHDDLLTSMLVDLKSVSTLKEHLKKVGNDPDSDDYQTNYATILKNGESITHNRFVVPESGALRFDLHVPEINPDRKLLVTLQAEGEDIAGISSFINLTRADRTRSRHLQDTKKIDYGVNGFETFNIDVPDNLRGKVATLKFEIVGDSTVYLDNVFFGSEHLLFGNPSNARNLTTDRKNYLLEKPQFATAYNDSRKTPSWVSWQLNQKWLGDSGRSDIRFIEDPFIPEEWGRITHENYTDSEYPRGHMMPSSHRTNSEKDNISTFLMTNVLPQHKDNNDESKGETPEYPAWTSFDNTLQEIVNTEQKELYIVAGGYGSNPNPQRFSHNSRPDQLTNPHILTDKGITIPGWTWKVVLELDQPGLRFDDVTTTNASAYAILTPNEVEPDHEPTNPDGSVGNNGDFPTPVVHPFNALLGETLPNIPNKAAWRNWETWYLSVKEVQDLTGLDFFSNLPDHVEEVLEA